MRRHRDRRAHRRHALGYACGLQHKAGTKSATRHALARAAAVEIDLVVTRLLSGACRRGELGGITAAQLQRERMLLRIESEQPGAITAHDRGSGDHLSVEQHLRREAAQEEAAMAIGPVHHGSD